ncbi:MAG: alpha/beta hydrolase [Opitutales bacterium]|nr:alpha/beta hydrolase [Opitutales bacterium]
MENRRVVLLHGLARTSRSMRPMEKYLKKNGFTVLNINYPSRKKPIEELSKWVRDKLDEELGKHSAVQLDFVTHSMGGIILRQIMKKHPLTNLGRVVMLGPPNQGSEVVDRLRRFKILKQLNGPACLQLGTEDKGFIHNLGKVEFDLGVIAGNKSINPLLSLLLPGEDDGKVTVERTKIEGMNDFRIVPCSHSFFMSKKKVKELVQSFLRKGFFSNN